MSSLFGIAGVQQAAKTLKRMAAAYAYGKTLIEQSAGLGLIYLPGFKSAPAWNKSRTVCVLVSGDIYTDRRVANPSKHVLEAYLKSDVDCARTLNGVFSIAIVDKRKGTIHCISDRFGISPLYYAVAGKQLIFGSEIKAVLASGRVPLDIDWMACRDLFDYGFMINDYTLAKGVRMLAGATILTFRNGSLSFKRYWSPSEIAIDYKSSTEQFVERGAKILREVMARQTADIDEAALFLSGGYDSRCIAAASKGLPVQISTYTTLHPAGIIEKQYAAKVAAYLNLKNTFVEVPYDNFKSFEEYAKIVDSEYAEHMWILPLVKQFTKPVVTFEGMCGDWIFKTPPEEPVVALRRHRGLTAEQYIHIFAIHYFKGGPKSDWHAAESLFSDDIRSLWSTQPNSSKELLENTPQTEYQISLAGLTFRVHRAVFSMSQLVANRYVQCRYPFLDNAVIDFGMSIPLHSKPGKGDIYKMIIERLSPGIMSLPSTNTKGITQRIKFSLWLTAIKYLPSLLLWRQNRLYVKQQHAPLEKGTDQLITHFTALAEKLSYPPGFDKTALKAALVTHAKEHTDPRSILAPSLLLGLWWQEANRLVKHSS